MRTIDWSKHKAVRTTSAYPIPDAFNEKRFTIQQLREAASRACIYFRGWPFIAYRRDEPWLTRAVRDGLETVVNKTERDTWGFSPLIEQWNLLRSGAFLHRAAVRELNYRDVRDKRAVDILETIYHVAEAIGSLWRLYETLAVPDEEDITIEFAYEDTQERELALLEPNERWLPPLSGLRCDVPTLEISRTQPLYLWRASDVQSAAEICLEIFQQFQWEPSLRQIEDEIRPFLGRMTPSRVR